MNGSYTLTKNDVKALKSADSLCFEYYHGEGFICARKDARQDKSGYTIECAEYRVGVDSRFYTFANSYKFEPKRCFSRLGIYRHNSDHDTTATFVDMLKEGDTITLEWNHGRGNGYLEGALTSVENVCINAPLYCNTLYATICRGSKKITFLLESQICPDNSAAIIEV